MEQAIQTFVLPLTFNANGQQQALYPVVLKNDTETILVDCGYPGFLPLLKEALQPHGLSLQELTGILITHHDIDHMGALFEIKESCPHIRVYTSKADAPYVVGKERSLRLQQAEAIFPCLPEEEREGALQFQALLQSMRTVAVDETIDKEGSLAFLPGAEALFTPGHMPGHLSLYLPNEKLLLAADAVVYEKGVFDIANPAYTLDLPEALQSVRKLQQLDVEKIVCYHGGVVETGIQQGLAELLARYA